jgi:hypothetical protein
MMFSTQPTSAKKLKAKTMEIPSQARDLADRGTNRA